MGHHRTVNASDTLDGDRARPPDWRSSAADGFHPAAEDPNRDPLPAGHPRSWDILVRGTCLEGVPYPAARADF